MPGGRRVDNMVGVVVDLVVGDEVVRTEASSRPLLTKVLKDRASGATQ